MEQVNISDSNQTTKDEAQSEGSIDKVSFRLWVLIQSYIDRLSIYSKFRWLLAGILMGIYIYRAYINNGIGFII